MEEVNQNQAIQEQVQAQQFQPKSPLPKFTLILIAVLVVGIIGGAYYFLGVKKDQPKACSQELKQCPDGAYVPRSGSNCEFTPCPPFQPKPTVDLISEWETYANTLYGYSIKYPQDLSLNDRDLEYLRIGNQIRVYVSKNNPENCTGDCPTIESTEDVKVGKYNARKINGLIGAIGGNSPGYYLQYVVYFNKNYYGLTLYEVDQTIYEANHVPKGIPEDKVKLFDQILSTFTFSPLSASKSPDQNQIDTSTWKTYESLKHKYSFNFPSGWRIEESSDPTYFTIYSFAEDKYIGQRGPIPSENLQLEAYLKNDINKSLDEWVKSDGEIIKTENINIDSVSAKKVWKEDNRGDQVLSVYYKSGTKGVIFYSWPHDTVYSKEFDEIVKSFKFTQ